MAIVISRVDPTPVPGAKTLAGSQMIINAVSTNMTSGYRLWPDASAKMANTQMANDQRFFQVELDQAVELLAVKFPSSAAPYGTDQETWRWVIGNNFGWRVTPIPACRPGFEMDRVSRACVPIKWSAPFPEPEPYVAPPEPEPLTPTFAPEEAAILPAAGEGGTPILLVAALGLVGLLLFR